MLGIGLNNTLSCHAVAAGRERNAPAAIRIVRITWCLFGTAVVVYGTFVVGLGSVTAVVNRFSAACEIPGLVAVWVVSYALVSAALPRRSELIGADHERALLRANVASAAIQVTVAVVLASFSTIWLALGAAATPLALAAQGASNTIGFGRVAKKMHTSTD